MKTYHSMLFCGGLVSCSNAAREPVGFESTDRVAEAVQSPASVALAASIPYDSLLASPAQFRPVAWRELLQIYHAGAGLYRVLELSGRTEQVGRTGAFEGFTYVALSLLEDWSGGAPATPTARVEGGPMPNGLRSSSPLHLSKGEVIGILWSPPTPENSGFFSLDELAVFRTTPAGGYSNGQHFTKSVMKGSQLSQLIRGTLAGTLSGDIEPDVTTSPDLAMPAMVTAPKSVVLAEGATIRSQPAASSGLPPPNAPSTASAPKP